MNDFSSSITFAVGVITGGLVVYACHIYSRYRYRRKEFNKAASKLRNAFLREVAYLEYGDIDKSERISTGMINEFLAESGSEHLRAITNFKPFLSKRKRIALDKAWDEYCHPDGVPEDIDKKWT